MQRIFIFALAISVAPLIAAEVPETIRDRGKAATVKVNSDTDQQFGSGVVIGQGGSHTYLLTAYHIVPTAKKVEVKVPDGKTYTAEVLERSPETDLAVLRLPTAAGLPAPIKLATGRVKPMSLISIGWEKGEAPTVLDESLKGKVKLKKPGEMNAVLCWEVVRKPAAGRSGGPLLDESGQLLGIASGHDGSTGYYVHIEVIHAFLGNKGLKWLTEEERQ